MGPLRVCVCVVSIFWPSTLCMVKLHGRVSDLPKLASDWLLPMLSVAKLEHGLVRMASLSEFVQDIQPMVAECPGIKKRR